MTEPKYVFDLDIAEFTSILKGWGEASYRAKQIWQGLYQQYWATPDEFSQLSKALRQKITDNFKFSHLTAATELHSSDQQTVKLLFTLPDGQAIETVLMKYKDRNTLCISTQAGCAMGCTFCATGQMGFRRNLSSGEIVEQVLYFARSLKAQDESVTNVVFMGMGEPFHNYDNTMAAIDRLNNSEGFNFGARRFTISTVGLIPAIKRFAQEKRQVNLAISLHATGNHLRTSMLPINKTYPIPELLDACREYIQLTNRRITFEWALIYDVNDTAEHAHQLGRLLEGMLCHVNVIPLNPTTGYDGKSSPPERVQEFQEILGQYGVTCTARLRRGIDISAGCGQLAIKHPS